MGRRYPSPRARLEAWIERAIDALDSLDGDAELEPSLGSVNSSAYVSADDQLVWAAGANDDDREQDAGDMAEQVFHAAE